jgi:hypothetical protein
LAVQDDYINGIPILTAVQLVRLRDRVKGATQWDYGAWLEPMKRVEEDTRSVVEVLNKAPKRAKSKARVETIRLVESNSRIFRRDFGLWKEVFPAEGSMIAKFLSLLAGLQLDVSAELGELKALSEKNEAVVHRMDLFMDEMQAVVAGGKPDKTADTPLICRDLLDMAQRLVMLKERVDERAEDAIRLITLLSSSVEPQTLMDLFTGEP